MLHLNSLTDIPLSVAGTPTLVVGIALAATLWCWLTSIVTGNCSQVDRLWSILPPIYIGCFAAGAGFADARLDLMTGLTALWGARLTYNFARKGGYRRGSEDYRWPVLRQRLGPVGFQIFNATFIAPFQNLVLVLLAGPAWLALSVLSRRSAPLGVLDGVAALFFVVFLIGETMADQQQWAFHRRKQAALSGDMGAVRPPALPFLTDGLFRYSRHPNFFCEQALWWCIYLFSVAASGQWLNPSLAGAVVLTLLFQGSTSFTEQLSLSKYPAYADYQRSTSRLWPWFPHR